MIRLQIRGAPGRMEVNATTTQGAGSPTWAFYEIDVYMTGRDLGFLLKALRRIQDDIDRQHTKE